KYEKYSEPENTVHCRSQIIFSIVLRSPKFNSTKKYGVVLLVLSAEYERSEREEIRNSWASNKESNTLKTGDSLVIFLVGRSFELDEEASTYGDLLQADIKETYRNLVYKLEVGYRWLNKNVKFDYVAKIDSDTVVHIDRLYNLLEYID
ncbi:hypothetical protein PENTCL1PPCAC_19107, partial [Pristionchus entomophagus]